MLKHLVSKLYKNLRCSFKVTANAAVKGKIYSIHSMQSYQRGIFAMVLKWSSHHH